MVTKKETPGRKDSKMSTDKQEPEIKKRKLIAPNIARPIMEKRIRATKRKLLMALDKTGGIVSPACKAIGLVGTNFFYQHYKEDEAFRKRVEDIREGDIDFTESQLQRNIALGKEASIFFKLKCLAKSRGYIERSQVDFNDISEPQKLKIGDNEIVFY